VGDHMRRIAFFGGSFDPIHLGHLNVIIRLLELKNLDHLYICPVNCSPFKLDTPPSVSGEHRKAMIELAIEGIDRVSCLDDELKREGPSYTFDTVKALMEREEGECFLILSDDAALHFDDWKEAEALLELAQPLIVPRRPFAARAPFPEKYSVLFTKSYCPIPFFEVSSTEVRERLSKKLNCSHLIPNIVLDYISKNRLY